MAAGLILVVCAAAVPFFLRVLIALCGEYKTVQICYLAQVQPAVTEISAVEPAAEEWKVAA